MTSEGHPPVEPVQEVPEADQEEVARTVLLNQLSGRARTRKELADRLAAKRVPEEVAVRLLDRFTEVGLIDDENFARTWVAQRQGGKGLARRALGQELRHQGIDDEIVRMVLEEVTPEEETEAARAAVRAKLCSVQRMDHERATRRLVGMLARKGHAPGVAYRVVTEELTEAGTPLSPSRDVQREAPEPE